MESVNQILKTKDLLPGSYLIESCEPTKSNYGINYLVCAENKSKEQFKFKIAYVNSKITIPGYSRKVILN